MFSPVRYNLASHSWTRGKPRFYREGDFLLVFAQSIDE